MTIVVDTPRWEWQGVRWAHLVSDESIEELHAFARVIQLRYLSYQGDHYDLPAPLLHRALDAGASLVDSRDLVRRLRVSGLRRRGGKRATAWTKVVGGEVEAVMAALDPGQRPVLGAVLRQHGPVGSVDLLQRPGERVTLLDLVGSEPRLTGSHGRADAALLVEAHDPRGHTLEVVWSVGR